MKLRSPKLRWLSFWASILTILSCYNSKQEQEVLTIAINPLTAKTYSIEEISDSLKYIQLETNDHCYIGYIDQMIIENEKIFILDAIVTKRILVFNTQGKHLFNINDDNNDPLNRIINIASMCIHDETLYVVDRNASKVFVYNMQGELIKIHHLPFIIQSLVVTDDFIVGRNTDPDHQEFPFNYIVFDSDFIPIDGFGKSNNPNTLSMIGRTDLMRNPDRKEILIHEGLNDTLYTYTGSEFIPFVHSDYGEYRLSEDERLNSKVFEVIVRKNSRVFSPVYFTWSGNHISYRYWWNKGSDYQDNRTQYVMINVEDGHVFHVSGFTCSSLTDYVDYFPHYRLRSTFYLAQPVYSFAKTNEYRSRFYGIYNNVNELKMNVSINDNPVVIVFTIKQHLIEG